jgi:O-antigen ligase
MIALVLLALLVLLGFTAWFPTVATFVWILILETSPDIWLDQLIGGHETIVAALKAAGLAIALLMALRFGARPDAFNPGFAFLAMFLAGLAHGLYPGLTLSGSLRSLVGSAAPFAFGFIRLPPWWRRAVEQAAKLGPSVTVLFGAVLAALGLHQMLEVQQGALRLGGSGQAAFLAGFALIAVYAGLLGWVRSPNRADGALLLVNLVLLALTGARAPLSLAAALSIGVFALQRRFIPLLAAAAAACLAVMFASTFSFLRVVDLAKLGEATDLSNRNLVWPYFEHAFQTSPWIGWGVGAGKVVVPLGSSLSQLIATNAAHNEYLRIGAEGGALGLLLLIICLTAWALRGSASLPPPQRWLMRAVFIAFAIHSATDNTLIATTSSVFFIWASAVFAAPPPAAKPVP